MRGPDLVQLGYERSLNGRSGYFSGVPVGPVRRQAGELVVEDDHHRLSLAGQARFHLLGLNLEKLGLATLARAVEPAAEAAPVSAVMPSAAAPINEATLRGVNDIVLPPFRPYLDSLDDGGPLAAPIGARTYLNPNLLGKWPNSPASGSQLDLP